MGRCHCHFCIQLENWYEDYRAAGYVVEAALAEPPTAPMANPYEADPDMARHGAALLAAILGGRRASLAEAPEPPYYPASADGD